MIPWFIFPVICVLTMATWWASVELVKARTDLAELSKIQGVALVDPARASQMLKQFEARKR